jgi:hypothetical protein
MLYTIIAYRWGWLNAHHYPVATLADREEALRLAVEARDDRGGKYGVVVCEWTSTTEYSQCNYFPSLYGETKPFRNERIEAFQDIGGDVHSVVTSGIRYWSPTGDGRQEAVGESAPDWVIASVRRREITCQFEVALREQRDSKPKDEAARTAWIKELLVIAERDTDDLLSKVPENRKLTLEAWAQRNRP